MNVLALGAGIVIGWFAAARYITFQAQLAAASQLIAEVEAELAAQTRDEEA